MTRRCGRTTIGGAVAALVLLAVVAAPAAAAPDLLAGELLVGVYGGLSGDGGGILALDPAATTPPRARLVADTAGPLPSANASFPVGTAFESDGSVVVVERQRLLRMDPRTGARTLLSGADRGTGPGFSSLWAGELEPDGGILLAETGGGDAIFRVDPITGDREVVTGRGVGAGPALGYPTDLAMLPDGDVLVLDAGDAGAPLLRVDTTTGDRTRVLVADPQHFDPVGGLVVRDGVAYYLSREVATGYSLFAVALATGTRRLVSGAFGADSAGTGPGMTSQMRGLAVGADGALYVGDIDAERVVRIDPATGDRAIALDAATETLVFDDPASVTRVPAAPTIALTDRTTLVGEPVDITLPTAPGADGQRATSVIAQSLPPGLTSSDLGDAVRITGTPTRVAVREVEVLVRNALHAEAPTFTWTVRSPAAGVEALEPGDVVATDYAALGGAILAVDREDGDLATISDVATPAPGEDGNAPLVGPSAAAFEAAGTLVAVTFDGDPAVVRIDPRTGRRTLVSASTRGTGPALTGPSDVLVLPDGTLVVVDLGSEVDDDLAIGALLRVDPVTGDRSYITGPTTGSGPTICIPTQATRDPSDGTLLVTTDNCGGAERASVFRVDPSTGARTRVWQSPDDSGWRMWGIARRPDGAFAAAEFGRGAVLAIDPVAGTHTVVSSDAVGTGPDVGRPLGLDVAPDGTIFTGSYRTPRQMLRITPGGDRALLVDGTTSVPAINEIDDVTLVPAPPAFDGPETLPFVVGAPGEGTVLTVPGPTGQRATSVTVTGALPAGLTVEPGTNSAVLRGTPTEAGRFEVTATLANAAFRVSRTYAIEVVAPPQTTIDGGPDGLTRDTTPTFTFSSSVDGSTFACRLGTTGAFSPCTSPRDLGPLAEGAYTFQVRAIDPAGNVDPTPASRSFTVAAPAPAPRPPAPPVVAPPVAGPPVVVPVPPAVGAAGSRATCRSARRVTINLMPPRGARLRSTVVRVNGRVVRRLDGRTRRVTLSFVGRPPSVVRVDLAARTTRGTRLAGRRTYRLCDVKGIPRIPLRPLTRAGRR